MTKIELHLFSKSVSREDNYHKECEDDGEKEIQTPFIDCLGKKPKTRYLAQWQYCQRLVYPSDCMTKENPRGHIHIHLKDSENRKK